MRCILLSEKEWHKPLFNRLSRRPREDWLHIRSKEDFSLDTLQKWKPDKIFIPHWSYLIPKQIHKQFECIVFHMTDLPYGRGGSPLQNLIAGGHSETMISAIRAGDGIDTGKIYLKSPLSLLGTAQEIFLRSVGIIEKMIAEIIEKGPEPSEQVGESIVFKRRTAEDGDISKLSEIEQIFDYIRMLDCEGYPNAFLETETLRLEFSRASLKSNNMIIADVRIIKK